MRFIDQFKKGQGNLGTYLLTLSIVIMTLIIGQTFVEVIAIQKFGYSLIDIPENADLNIALSLLLLPFGFVLVALMLCIKYLHKRSILSVFTARESFDWRRFLFSFVVWGGIMVVFLVISMLTDNKIEWNFDWTSFFPLLLVSIFILPIQTTAEEVLFRGYLFQGFGQSFKKAWISILITGVLFGMLHWANPEVAKIGDILVVFYVLTGVFLGIVTHMDDGLELSMGYHAVNNIFAALVLTNDWQAFQTNAMFIDHADPVFGWDSIITLLVLQPLLLLLFARKYKWSNWKKKLFQSSN